MYKSEKEQELTLQAEKLKLHGKEKTQYINGMLRMSQYKKRKKLHRRKHKK